VFIAEDSFLVLESLKKLISEVHGLEFAGSATDADSALSGIRDNSPSLIILDLRLHGSNGLDVLRSIKKGGEGSPFVIVFSGHADCGHRDLCRTLGADLVFRKPEEVGLLKDAIRSFASRSATTSGGL
jgi:DNA-binding NarL/FixJ family response regulator